MFSDNASKWAAAGETLVGATAEYRLHNTSLRS